MFDMVSRRGFVSLSAVAAAGLGLAGCSGNKTSEPAGSDASSAKASSKKAVELQVFAANSLEKALPEVQELYTEQTGTTFADTQFKASGDLVEQMRAGATVDVLITASKGTMDDAETAELVDAGFCVGAAAYPEGHIACEDLNLSVEHLKQKQDAGASFFVTQLFFDNECFYRFRELADKAGITVPITAGIMPFMGKSQISRMVFMCGASLPSPVIKILAKYENDPESLQAAGVDYAARQLCDLKEHGADGLHLYTMNRPAIAATIMERLG